MYTRIIYIYMYVYIYVYLLSIYTYLILLMTLRPMCILHQYTDFRFYCNPRSTASREMRLKWSTRCGSLCGGLDFGL